MVAIEKDDDSGGKKKGPLHAVAGGLAGACARLAVGPLDVVKIRMQVQIEPIARGVKSKYTGLRQALGCIVREEGVKGLWRGTTPALALTVPYCAVQFAALNQWKSLAAERGWKDFEAFPLLSFAGGAIAGAAATTASYPFDLLRTILASQGSPPVYKNMRGAAAGIFRQKGVRGLFSGIGITLIEIVPYAGIQFGSHDALRKASDSALEKFGFVDLSSSHRFAQEFAVGFMAGILGKVVTHPLDVVKKRYHVAGLQRPLSYGARVEADATAGLWKLITHMYRREGARGFFKGLTPSLVKAAPYSAITFAIYELILGSLVAQGMKQQ